MNLFGEPESGVTPPPRVPRAGSDLWRVLAAVQSGSGTDGEIGLVIGRSAETACERCARLLGAGLLAVESGRWVLTPAGQAALEPLPLDRPSGWHPTWGK